MITIKLTEEEADILFDSLTATVDEMTEDIERLTKIEKAFDRIRNRIRREQK